jgi:putative acyl-CoA dehydrogenase
MTRIYRQSPLNSIWEGSGNVVCLDILRAMARDPRSVEAFSAELALSRGTNRMLDRAIDAVTAQLAHPTGEAHARRLAEALALTLQGAVLVKTAPDFVADAFCATRLGESPGLTCGAIDAKIDADAIIARAMPQ